MTLLEIMVVLLIFVLLAGALTVGYGRLPATAMRRQATRLAAVLRAAYDRATASGAHHRVILDLDEGTFALERCEGRIQVRKSRDLAEETERKRVEAEKATMLAAMQNGDQLLNSMIADAGKKLTKTTKCEPVKGPMGKPQKLGGYPEVSFKKVYVSHLETPADKGQVTINFFPLGTAERAVIELGVDEERFSVVLHPLSGRIEMQQGEWRDAEDTVSQDAEGKQIE